MTVVILQFSSKLPQLQTEVSFAWFLKFGWAETYNQKDVPSPVLVELKYEFLAWTNSPLSKKYNEPPKCVEEHELNIFVVTYALALLLFVVIPTAPFECNFKKKTAWNKVF